MARWKQWQVRVRVFGVRGSDPREVVLTVREDDEDAQREALAVARVWASALMAVRSVAEVEIETWTDTRGFWRRGWYGFRTRVGGWYLDRAGAHGLPVQTTLPAHL